MSQAALITAQKRPFIGGLIGVLDDMFSSPERMLKKLLQKGGLISNEQRKFLDDGNAPGFAKGDAGLNDKLQVLGIDPDLIANLCQRLGVPSSSVNVSTWDRSSGSE